jgi:hypothetical protein
MPRSQSGPPYGSAPRVTPPSTRVAPVSLGRRKSHPGEPRVSHNTSDTVTHPQGFAASALLSVAASPRWSSDGIAFLSDTREYNNLVKVKTSITLPKELLGRLDRVDKNRSALLERAARAYLAHLEKQARDRRDIEIIDRNAERLNREAMDTLEYQQLP